MMAIFDKIAEFDESKEEWPLYAERLEYFTENDIDNADRQKSYSLSVFEARTYQTLQV